MRTFNAAQLRKIISGSSFGSPFFYWEIAVQSNYLFCSYATPSDYSMDISVITDSSSNPSTAASSRRKV